MVVLLVLAMGGLRPCPADAPETRAVVVVERDPRSIDRRFLAGLQQRHLLRLAEAHCRARLADPRLPPRSRAELTAELARTYALRAAESVPEERPALWHRAHQVTADFHDRARGNPYGVLVRFRDAVVSLDQGELARTEVEMGAGRTRLVEQVRGELRTALRKLQAIDSELDAARRRRRGELRAAEQVGLTSAELEAVQNHVAYQIARALRNQGQCYAVASADRTAALEEALQRLTPLAELPVADELIWQSRMDRAICYRLLGKTGQADKTLSDLVAAGPPPPIAQQVRAERIRLLLASERSREAFLETDIGVLKQAAQSFYRSGDLTEALAVYDRMGAQATAAGDAEQAFDAAFTAATIAHDRARRNRERPARSADDSEAMVRYSKLARAFPDHPRAAEAHLLAIYHAAAIARQVASANRQQALARYSALIEEHLTRWPQTASAVQTRWWLGRLREAQRRWQEAIAAYRDIPPDEARHEAAVGATIRCYMDWLAALVASGQETGPQARDAVAYFRAQITQVGAVQLADLVGRLAGLADNATGQQRRALAALALQAADLAADGGIELEGETARRFETGRAAALAAAGQYREARSAYAALERAYPDDRRIDEAHARLLGQSQEANLLDQALIKWQQVQRMSEPGTARWFRARYGQALAYAGKGEKEKAVRLIKITRVLRPELGGPEMRDRFLKLLSRCD